MTTLLGSWQLALEEGGKSPKTIVSYLGSVRAFTAYLAANNLPDNTELTGPPQIRAFLASEIKRTSAVSAQVHCRNLRVWFGWLAREAERTTGAESHAHSRQAQRTRDGQAVPVR